MKNSEENYLDKLFASSSDLIDRAEVEIPLLDVPEDLSGKLYAIAEPASVNASRVTELAVKRGFLISWPKVTGIAASLLVAIMGVQFYQQQQTLNQLEAAQADLATALHYLGEANRIAQAQVLNSLNDNMNKAGALPAIEIERGDIRPNLEARPETKILNRTL